MPYLGQSPSKGDENNFKILDDISSYTLTFDGSSASVVSAANDTITTLNHRFITGQRVTYNKGGGTVITGLSDGVYYIIKEDHHTIKLATSASNANSGTAVNITGVGAGASHTLNVAFDGVNTKFKATHNNGTKANITRSAQLVISINGVIQQPHDSTAPSTGFGFDLDGTIVLSQAPAASDVFWSHVLTNNNVTFDISDNTIDNFTGNGSATTFNLSKTPANNDNILVTIDGVVQYPDDNTNTRAYTVVENVLTFTSAPASGTEIQVRHIGFAGSTSAPLTGFYGRTGNAVLKSTDNITVNDAAITGNATISGNLTVDGTTTTLDTTLMDVDRIEVLDNSTNVAVAITQQGNAQGLLVHADTNYKGILVNGNNAPTLGFNTGDNDTPKWKIGLSGSNSNDLAIGKGAGNTNQFRLLDSGGASLLGTLTAEHLGLDGYLYHNGDTNTRVRFPAADTFTVETGGSERFRVDSDGKVTIGIGASANNNVFLTIPRLSGTGSPLRLISLRNDTAPPDLDFVKSRSTTYGSYTGAQDDDFVMAINSYIDTGSALSFRGTYRSIYDTANGGVHFMWGSGTAASTTGEKMRLTSTGNLGIGTDNPATALDIVGDLTLTSSDGGSAAAPTIRLQRDSSSPVNQDVLGQVLFGGKDSQGADENYASVAGKIIEKGGGGEHGAIQITTRKQSANVVTANLTSTEYQLLNGTNLSVDGNITGNGNFQLTSTDTGSSAAPELTLHRNSASPAAADYLGQIKFAGKHSGGSTVNYAKITGKILDSTDGSEDGILEFAFQKAGSNNISGRFRSDKLQLVNGTGLEVAGIVTASQGVRVPNGSATTNYISVGDATGGALRFWATTHSYADMRSGTLHFRNASLQNVLEIQQDKDVFFYGNAYLQNARFDQTVTIADTITHHGDTDTKIRFPTNDQIQFETNGSTWFHLGSTGAFQFGNNSDTGAKLYIKNSNSDANNTNALALDIQGGWIRIGDAILGNQTYSNGMGIKFHDSAVAHWSAGVISGDFYISQTSNNGNQLFPSSRTDALYLSGSGNAIFAGDITAGGNLYIPDKIYHVGDTDTYLSFDANTINLHSGGTTGLSVLDSSVRVPTKLGINGAAPQVPLDVIANGSGYAINIRGRSSDNTGELRFTSNNYGSLYGTLKGGATYLNFSVGSISSLLRLNSTGLVTMDNTAAQLGLRDSGVVDNAIFYIGGGTRTQTSTTTDFTQICLYDKNSQYNTNTANGSWKSKIKFFAAQMNGGAREGAFVGQDTTYNNFSGGSQKMRSDLIFGTRGDAQTSSSDPATEKLRIRHNGQVQISEPSGSSGDGASLKFFFGNNNSTDVISQIAFANNVGEVAHIQGETRNGNTNGMITFHTDISGTSAEKFRVNHDGGFCYGTDSSRTAEFTQPDGFSIRYDDKGQFQTSVTNTTCGLINRKGSDGQILGFRKDGTGVGEIGVISDNIYINFGGTTSAAHQLDDYEEGHWVPSWGSYGGSQATGAFTYSAQHGIFTKVGRICHCSFYMAWSAMTTAQTGSYATIDGLPFTVGTHSGHAGASEGGTMNVNWFNTRGSMISGKHIIGYPHRGHTRIILGALGQTNVTAVSPSNLHTSSTWSGGSYYIYAEISFIV